ETAEPAPLRFTRTDELVDDHLRAVHEVAELRFPDDERRRIGGRVTVFEAEHGFFGKHGVRDLKRRLPLSGVLQRYVALVCVLLVQHRVTVEERATARILARETDGVAFLD